MAGLQFYHGIDVIEIDDGIRPLKLVQASIIGLVGTAPDADTEKFPLDTPVLITGSLREAAKLGHAGTLPAALTGIFDQVGATVVVVRVAEGADADATVTSVIGATDLTTGAYSGIQALRGSRDVLGIAPKILIAPGFSQNKAVADALLRVAEETWGFAIIDGPNTTDEAAIEYREEFDSARLYLVDPWCRIRLKDGSEGVEPASARVAGVVVKSDYERGWWWSPSNRPINGILGMARPISWAFNDPNTRANYLNEHDVTTIIHQEGYRTFGNRTLASDQRWAFLSHRRIADMLNESIMRSHFWALDRNITRTFIDDVIEGVNDYMRYLKRMGAIIGGRCYVDPELNTKSTLESGHIYFDFEFTAPSIAERITFRSLKTTKYLTEVLPVSS